MTCVGGVARWDGPKQFYKGENMGEKGVERLVRAEAADGRKSFYESGERGAERMVRTETA